MTTDAENIWDRAYKIPWNDPGFSKRMLIEHLSQDHDKASRRSEWIQKQVAWIHKHLLCGKPSRVLDLGCGPGLYSHRLASLGHNCLGIDFGPASIEYALKHRPDRPICDFILGDIRHIEFSGPNDLVMVLFGEVNAFSPEEVRQIFRKAHASCQADGQLIVEASTPASVKAIGTAEASEYDCESGLFSDHPYRCRTENHWLPDEQAAIQTFSITGTDTGQTRVYRNTLKAWSENEMINLLGEAGFTMTSQCEAWPSNTDTLQLWLARKG